MPGRPHAQYAGRPTSVVQLPKHDLVARHSVRAGCPAEVAVQHDVVAPAVAAPALVAPVVAPAVAVVVVALVLVVVAARSADATTLLPAPQPPPGTPDSYCSAQTNFSHIQHRARGFDGRAEKSHHFYLQDTHGTQQHAVVAHSRHSTRTLPQAARRQAKKICTNVSRHPPSFGYNIQR